MENRLPVCFRTEQNSERYVGKACMSDCLLEILRYHVVPKRAPKVLCGISNTYR